MSSNPKPQLSPTERYIRRVDEHLMWELRTDAERRAFLDAEHDKWQERFTRFEQTQGDAFPGASAFDFAETLAALGGMRAKYEAEAA